MAFVRERIPESEMYRFQKRAFQNLRDDLLQRDDIAIDRERDIFLVCPGQGNVGNAGSEYPTLYVFCVQGVCIPMKTMINETTNWDFKFTAIYIPMNLVHHTTEILGYIEGAFRIFSRGGSPELYTDPLLDLWAVNVYRYPI